MFGFGWPTWFTSTDPVATQNGATQAQSVPPLPHPHQEQLARLTSDHVKQLEKILQTIADENTALHKKCLELEGELRNWKAGRKEDAEELVSLRKQVKMLTSSPDNLIVAILDFEADCFAPGIFHSQPRTSAGLRAASRIMAEVSPATKDVKPTIMLWMFMPEHADLTADLIAEGYFKSADEIHAFVNSFNSLSPLVMMIQTREPTRAIRERQQGLSQLFLRTASCKQLVLGRWVLETDWTLLLQANTKIPSKSETFDPKLKFIELPSHLRAPSVLAKATSVIRMQNILRTTPLRRGLGRLGQPQLDYTKGFLEQHPPLCLDFYLIGCLERVKQSFWSLCTPLTSLSFHERSENCQSSHGYNLSPSKTEQLRLAVTSTPCHYANEGLVCPLGPKCLFAHACPRGELCRRVGCAFRPHLHPAPPRTLPQRLTYLDRPTPSAPARIQTFVERHYADKLQAQSQPLPIRARSVVNDQSRARSRLETWQQEVASATSSAGHSLYPTLEPRAAATSMSKVDTAPPLDLSKLEALTDEELLALADKLRMQEEDAKKVLRESAATAAAGDLEVKRAKGQRQKLDEVDDAESELFGWRQLTHAQEELFMNLVSENERLARELDEDRGPTIGSLRVAEIHAYMRDIEAEKEELKTRCEVAELETMSAKRKLSNNEDRLNQLEQAHSIFEMSQQKLKTSLQEATSRLKVTESTLRSVLDNQEQAVQVQTSKKSSSLSLVLIDGTTAPFADGLLAQGAAGGRSAARQVLWEASKHAGTPQADSEEQKSVACFVFYDRAAMLSRLFRAQVISSGATWDAFSTAFNAEPACHLVDCGSSIVVIKMAAAIRMFSPLDRIFVAGVHPSSLAAEAEDEASAVQQAIKLVVINYVESNEDAEFVRNLGYPVTDFGGLFSRDPRVASSLAHRFSGNNGSDEDASQAWSSPVSHKSTDTRKTTNHVEGRRLRKVDPNKASHEKMGCCGVADELTNCVVQGFLSQGEYQYQSCRGYRLTRRSRSSDPQICAWHYLSEDGCFAGKKCHRGHDYELNDRQLAHFAVDISRVGCKEKRKTGFCTWRMKHGTTCMFSHDPNAKRTF
ncbi:hypothetical protein ACM66B_005145 [Microbotryomycetes sp. NB124-2]